MSDPIILQEKQPQRFEGRNIRTPKRSGATNDIYLVSFEITREAWESLESVPKNALLEGVIWFHFGDPEPEEKAAEKPKREKKPKLGTDDNGKYWQAMHHLDWWYAPGLCEVLGCEKTEESAAHALKVAFDVSSRREISADDFEAWCERQRVESAVTISRQARVKAEAAL